ncbi:single-stranded-DNA-specific exonuclease RecJ [Rhodospirillum rubrum]|uniref:single-stranded-DNA-specific exonuclease RecJ n=1 Tax=Rhodospirillum rubrum TaxID=1085 RepID=UPI00190317C4|nr:single-stranded-DNA-specific exonuclease RecJ [Rhodospirillum rubrum]MBK1663788.1 single-stranded-DNA-specific exonuclease RecJ [Rhodospirillum rubrum]MBK1677719.1 single-stranded-DNA-specific exonuclease RecJ [Rhodospirillum rubrum]
MTDILTPAAPPALPTRDAAFLGVERSRGGRRWVLRPGDERQALAISQRLGVPEVVGRVLAGRGVQVEEADGFLTPTLRALLPDPGHLLDMDKAVARLSRAVRDKEKIAIFGDYDVDGATSTALMHRFFRSLGARVLIHIPDRVLEGYGPNAPALEALAAKGARVVLTVDCGISAFDALRAAKAAGLDVVVCDHHEARTELPAAVAVVNPKRLDETSPHTHLAAVGVAFLMAVAINRELRDSGWFAAEQRPPPDLMALLDLVALGTVCDMVPLIGVNRALVQQGLKVIAKRTNPGIASLAEVSGVRDRVDAFHLGFMLGPRVNAGGRVGQAGMGAALLSSEDPLECLDFARQLDAFNGARKEIEAAVLHQAIEQVEAAPANDLPLVFASGTDWHPGVVGIVASRLKERYGLPACAVALDGGLAKGSGRSVGGVDLGRVVIAAREAGVLEAGGGHAMAAGFSLRTDRLEEFRQFLGERLKDQVAALALVASLDLDGVLDVRGANAQLVRALSQAGPYGSGNPEPRFAVANARVGKVDVVGMGHVRCFLTGPSGGSLKAMAFKAADSEIGHALLTAHGASLHVAGTLRLDSFQGRETVVLVVDDVAPCS